MIVGSFIGSFICFSVCAETKERSHKYHGGRPAVLPQVEQPSKHAHTKFRYASRKWYAGRLHTCRGRKISQGPQSRPLCMQSLLRGRWNISVYCCSTVSAGDNTYPSSYGAGGGGGRRNSQLLNSDRWISSFNPQASIILFLLIYLKLFSMLIIDLCQFSWNFSWNFYHINSKPLIFESESYTYVITMVQLEVKLFKALIQL